MKKGCIIIKRAALFVVMAGIVGGNTIQAEPIQARIDIKAVDGTAFISRNGTDYYPVHAGEIAGPGSILKTTADSTVDLFLPDSGTVLRMRPDSMLQFARLDKMPAGELTVSDTSLKLLKGSVIGSQHKLSTPSHFEIATSRNTATIVGTEYVVNADGAVSVLDGTVSLNYNLPGGKGSVKVSVPAGYSFDPATGTVIPTTPAFLQNLIADINTVKNNAQVFKANGATIVVQPEQPVSPIHGGGNGQGQNQGGSGNGGQGQQGGNSGNQGGGH